MASQEPRTHRPAAPRDLPARMREQWDRLRVRLGTNQAMAGTAAIVAVVLSIAVVSAVMAASGGDEPEPVSQAVEDSATPSASDDPSPSDSGKPSKSDSPSPKETEDETSAAGEEPDEEQTSKKKEEDPTPAAGMPYDAYYLVRQEASGLCLSSGPEPGNEGRTVVVLEDCGSAYPSLKWTAWDDGVYAVSMYFDDWTPCMGADAPADSPGYLVAAYDCDFTETQFWELKPLGGDVYSIRVSASGLCMGLLEGQSARAGSAVATASCDGSDSKQRWALL